MIPVYQYLNLQRLTVASVQQHVPTPPSRFLSQSFPLNLKQWCQQNRVRLIKEKHLYKRQKQLYAITEVRWNSGPQMIMHCPKRSRAWKGGGENEDTRLPFYTKSNIL